MKILGTILVILGVLKGLTINNVSIKNTLEDVSEESDLPVNPDTINNVAKSLFILETVLEIVCGLFIVFL